MQILLAFIAGTLLGIAAHFAAPSRGTRGVVLGPVLGALIGGLTWTIFTWAGVGIDNVWIWVVSFAMPFVVVYPTLVVLARARLAHDARERVRLRVS